MLHEKTQLFNLGGTPCQQRPAAAGPALLIRQNGEVGRERARHEMHERAGSKVSKRRKKKGDDGQTGSGGSRGSGRQATAHVKKSDPAFLAHGGRTSFQILSGWRVFQIPSAPWVPKYRQIGLLRPRLGVSREASSSSG